MISDDELFEAMHDARGDNQVAFVKIEQKLRKVLHDKLTELDHSNSLDALNAVYLQYMNDTIGAAIYLEIPSVSEWEIPTPHQSQDHVLRPEYQHFTMLVDRLVMHVRLSQAGHSVKFSVHLDSEDKIKIRHFCDQIKEVVESAEVPLEKREALLSRLNAFVAEVDRDRTRLEVFGDFVIGCATIVGTSVERMKPLTDAIVRILGKAQADEPKRLPPTQTKRLPAPPKKLPAPDKKKRDLDDDIPF